MEGCGYFLTILAFYLSSLDYFFCSLLINGILRIQKEKKIATIGSFISFSIVALCAARGLFSRLLLEVFFGNRHLPPLLGPIFFFGNYRVWRNTFKSTLLMKESVLYLPSKTLLRMRHLFRVNLYGTRLSPVQRIPSSEMVLGHLNLIMNISSQSMLRSSMQNIRLLKHQLLVLIICI